MKIFSTVLIILGSLIGLTLVILFPVAIFIGILFIWFTAIIYKEFKNDIK